MSLRAGGIALVLFLALLVVLPITGRAAPHSLLALAGIFYQAGALVPRGWLPDDVFLAGYGATQAMPVCAGDARAAD